MKNFLGQAIQHRAAVILKLLDPSSSPDCLAVDIATQTLSHYQWSSPCGWEHKVTYPISTSKHAPSCISGSHGTPLGLHKIAEKHGDGSPSGHVFKSRIDQGIHYQDYLLQYPGEDCITTRILWLAGLEDAINHGQTAKGQLCDSYHRMIYIHGTHDEAGIDAQEPRSHGCIRMKNADVLALYNTVPVGAFVYITNSVTMAT